MQELSAMVDYPAEWRRLAQEFYDIPDPQENLRAFKKDGRWQLTGGISAEHDPARIRYRYRSLAERAAALAGTKTGSLEEWLELLATKGPPHETRRGGADAPRMAGVVLHPHIPAIERLSIVSSDFCKRLEAEAFAEVVCVAPKSEESAPSRPATVANTETRLADDRHRSASPDSGSQAVEEPGSSEKPGTAEVIKAPALPGANAIERPRSRGTPGALKTRPDETATKKPTGLRKWDEVEIFIPNELEAQIVLPNLPTRVRGFENMGFADRRGKGATKPNTLWDLLLAFARLKGRIENPKQAGLSDWKRVEQRVWALNRALKRHFDIPDSPIRFIDRGYGSVFKIKADPLLDL
jgi:hypothetical protein